MDQMKGFRIAAKYEKKSLLFAINCVAALSIFFFVREPHREYVNRILVR